MISEAWDPNGATPMPELRTFQALWDTGATRSAITQNVVGACGLSPTSFTDVQHAGGITRDVPVYLVNISLISGVRFTGVEVAEGKLPKGMDVVIGMDIITRGDFAVTNQDGKTMFSFRIPSKEPIDFVADDNRAGMPGRRARPSDRKRQELRRKRKK